MTTYLTADWHFGHENIIAYCDRPFDSVEEMDETIIENVRNTVDPGDELWILGDITGPPTPDDVHSKLARIPCMVKWIEGNHDPNPFEIGDVVQHRGSYAEISTGFKNQKGYELSVALFHYPMMRWNGSYHGHFHAHGHVHGGIDNSGERRMDVGVDAQGFEPVSMSEFVDDLVQIPAPKER